YARSGRREQPTPGGRESLSGRAVVAFGFAIWGTPPIIMKVNRAVGTGERPKRIGRPRNPLVFAGLGLAGAFALVWLIVAVVAPLKNESKCAGVEFRTAVKVSPFSRPRI